MCLKTFIVNDCSLHNIKKKYWTPAQPVVFPQGIKRVFVGIKNQLQKKHTRTNARIYPTHTRTHTNSHTTWSTERRLYICKIDFILSKSENRKVEKKKWSHLVCILWRYFTIWILLHHITFSNLFREKQDLLTYIFILMYTLFHNLYNKFPIQC